jgi:hypothetical protein
MDNKFDELREALENVDTEKFSETKEDTSANTNTFDTSSSFTVNYGNLGIGTGGTSSSFWCSTASSWSGNVTIGASGSPYTVSGLNGSSSWSTISSTSAGLHVTSDAEFEGDIKWKGRSLGNLLQCIEDRLAILAEPDPVKLEKFAALKKAYDHYKLMEKLIGDE